MLVKFHYFYEGGREVSIREEIYAELFKKYLMKTGGIETKRLNYLKGFERAAYLAWIVLDDAGASHNYLNCDAEFKEFLKKEFLVQANRMYAARYHTEPTDDEPNCIIDIIG